VILSFRHRGLERFYEDDDKRGVNPDHAAKISTILARLDVATSPADMDLPGLRLHQLKGGLAGHWSVTVRANWRIIFRFAGADAADLDYLDYH
jgi:proteic killer suppression protein